MLCGGKFIIYVKQPIEKNAELCYTFNKSTAIYIFKFNYFKCNKELEKKS